MRRYGLFVSLVVMLLILGIDVHYSFGEESTETVVKESNPEYDNVTWQDVNHKREEREKKNFFSNIYYTLFKHHEETTYTGEKVDVVQTAGNVDYGDDDAPIQYLHITSDQ